MAKSTAGDTTSNSPASSSPTFKFFNHLKLPQNLTTDNTFELNETDVFWSSSSDVSDIPSPSNVSTSPPVHRHNTSGLYAALSGDQHPLVRRKPNMSPSQSATTAARTIPPVALRQHSPGYHYHQSAPVNVPVWPTNKGNFTNLGLFDEANDDVDDDDDDDGGGEMVPPHEIVARSYVTFSVFEGVGRTLKGRDLRSVRNAVFQRTGFLD